MTEKVFIGCGAGFSGDRFDASIPIVNEFKKINAPKYEMAYSYERDFDLTDIFQFTKGQPYEKFLDLREKAPVYFHETGPEDTEPGFLGSYKI